MNFRSMRDNEQYELRNFIEVQQCEEKLTKIISEKYDKVENVRYNEDSCIDLDDTPEDMEIVEEVICEDD